MSRLVNMSVMLEKAVDEGYAVAQLNINNLEWTQAILEAAQDAQSPVILGVSEGAGRYMGGYPVVYAMVTNLLEEMDITVPVALHLDHGQTVEGCIEAIDAGFTSVMIDASQHPIDKNIEMTKAVVDYARPKGVTVEAEVGVVGGEEDGVIGEVVYADKDECVRMVNEAGITALAAALGSVHGPYRGEPELGFDEMQEIFDATKTPLVLHGASGIPDDQIRKTIERGHAKINVNTEIQQQWTKIVRELLNEDPDVYDPRKIIGPGKAGIIKEAKRLFDLFGSAGKA